jgi:hypothetical protein
MPAGDGTGPLGMGPMTGRGMGYCAGYPTPGFANTWPARFGRGFFGRGFGAGFGRGRGNRFWARATGMPGWYRAGIGYPAFGRWPAQASVVPVQTVQPVQPVQQPAYPWNQPTKEQELQMLEQERSALGNEMKAIEQEINELQKRIEETKKK